MHKGAREVRRTITALLLMLALSFGTVFAADEIQTGETTGAGTQTEVQTGTQTASPASNHSQAAAKAVVSNVIKKGKYYYYKDPKTGKIRKKKGFVRDNGKLYYVGKKGRITTGKSFKVKKKYYRAAGNGVIQTGVYRWKKKHNYSNANGVWIKKESIVSWNGSQYYIRKGGVVATNDAFGYKNKPYKADSTGKLTVLAIPNNGNPVTNVAKKQVGVMTGKTYWKWYFHTKFKNTDATPWCGAFVAWCFNKAGVYSLVTPVKSYGNLGYVPSYSKYANKKGKWISKENACGGDIIIYAGSAHVGLVEGISDGCLITIEGNSGPTALIRGKPGAVVRKALPLNSKKIKGIIRVF